MNFCQERAGEREGSGIEELRIAGRGNCLNGRREFRASRYFSAGLRPEIEEGSRGDRGQVEDRAGKALHVRRMKKRVTEGFKQKEDLTI